MHSRASTSQISMTAPLARRRRARRRSATPVIRSAFVVTATQTGAAAQAGRTYEVGVASDSAARGAPARPLDGSLLPRPLRRRAMRPSRVGLEACGQLVAEAREAEQIRGSEVDPDRVD